MPAKPAKPQNPEEPDTTSFEDALTRLEEIVEHMESEQLPLDDLIKHYEQGVALSKLCASKLEAAEQKVKLITNSPGGEISLSDFDPASQPADKEPAASTRAKPANLKDTNDEITLF